MRLKLRHISTLSRAKNIRPSYNGKAGRAKLGYDNIVLSAGTMANQQLSGLVLAHNDPDVAVVRVESQVPRLGLGLGNIGAVAVLHDYATAVAYDIALDGYGLAETAAALEQDGVFNPTYYWRSKGTSRGGSKSTVEPTKWGHTTIKKILTLQEYCGDVINFKSYSKSYKVKKRIENPEENRAIFLNVHEAIIDRPTWEKVQSMKKGTRRRRPTVTQEPSAFSGVLKCPESAAAASTSTSTRATTLLNSLAVKTTIPACASAPRPTISGWNFWSGWCCMR